ncbi:MAG: LemA family protein [Solirubrobacterales bacterium]|nr:LemA family protein [Solirubrobacterales bacterium]
MLPLILIGCVILAIALFVLITYNRLVRMRLACRNSWAQIEVALKLRHDLVPNLVGAVSGYATHERTTFERTAEARSAAVAAVGSGPAARGAVEGALATGIGNLIGVAEAYPELKASENFGALQRELASVEERISITRRVYNDTVETLNTAVAVFPQSVVASAFGFRAREFFTAEAEVHVAPTVELGGGTAR